MTRPILIGGLSVVLSAVLLVSAAAPPDPAAGPDIVDADALARADPEAAPAFRELDARLAVAQHRIGVRQEVARDLVAGWLTLDQAAARFRELNAAQPAALAVLSWKFPGATEEELVCRQVLGFVRALAWTEPAVRQALPALAAEVDRRFPSPDGHPTA